MARINYNWLTLIPYIFISIDSNSTPCMNNSVKQYVVIKAKGGLGNRILCAITGLLYAEATNRTPIVDWTDGMYDAPKINAFPHLFSYSKAGDQTSLLPKLRDNIYPDIWNGRLDKSISEMMSDLPPRSHRSRFIHRKFSINVQHNHTSHDIVVFWNYIDRLNNLRPLLKRTGHPFANLDRCDIIGEFLKTRLRIQPKIQSAINGFCAENFKHPTIGVHMRYTDRKISLRKYQTAIDRVLKLSPASSIFLASDSKEATKWLVSKYDRVFTAQKWMPNDGGPIHHSEDPTDRNRMAREALIDIYLLAKCDYLIYPSNSTFSFISHCLNLSNKSNHTDIVKFSPTILINKFLREFIA